MQGGIHHQGFFGPNGSALAGLFDHNGGREFVVGEGGRVGVGRGQGQLPVGPHSGLGFGLKGVQFGFRKPTGQQLLVEAR